MFGLSLDVATNLVGCKSSLSSCRPSTFLHSAIIFVLCLFVAFRGRSRGFRRGFGDRVLDSERRVEEESAPDSQDLSSAASLDRDSGSSNEESGPGRRQRRRRPRKVDSETNGRPNILDNSSSGSRLHSALSSKEGTPAETTTKNASQAGSLHSAAASGPPHSRDQRNRYDKPSGSRKPITDPKAHEEPVNGTTA